jgi:hypothetical protein
MHVMTPARRPALPAELIVANDPDPVFVCDLKGKIAVRGD